MGNGVPFFWSFCVPNDNYSDFSTLHFKTEEENILKREEEFEECVTFEDEDESKGEDVRRE